MKSIKIESKFLFVLFNQKLPLFAYGIIFIVRKRKKDLIIFGRNLKIPIVVAT